MANTKQAKKRVRQSAKRYEHNKSMRSMMRTHVKSVRYAIEKKDKEAALTAYKVAVPVLDRMAGKNIIHKNKAARYKSRLYTQINAL